jgi:hypothetical protein
MSKFIPQRKIKIRWSPNFAYAIGLITTDGNLSGDKRHISFKSTDYQLIRNLKIALHLKNKITKHLPKDKIHKICFEVQFGDVIFYRFLNRIGLYPAKSKIIQKVRIPDKFFANFLRGLFDGDGTFYSFWDKRWPNSFVFQLSFASASLDFLKWLKFKLATLYRVKGFICKGKGVFNLRHTKGDSKKLFSKMYYNKNLLILSRKYVKIKNTLLKDKITK